MSSVYTGARLKLIASAMDLIIKISDELASCKPYLPVTLLCVTFI